MRGTFAKSADATGHDSRSNADARLRIWQGIEASNERPEMRHKLPIRPTGKSLAKSGWDLGLEIVRSRILVAKRF